MSAAAPTFFPSACSGTMYVPSPSRRSWLSPPRQAGRSTAPARNRYPRPQFLLAVSYLSIMMLDGLGRDGERPLMGMLYGACHLGHESSREIGRDGGSLLAEPRAEGWSGVISRGQVADRIDLSRLVQAQPGWVVEPAAAFASRTNRRRTSGLSRASTSGSFSATGRFSPGSIARKRRRIRPDPAL